MNLDSVLQTRSQSRVSSEALETQERRIVRVCLLFALVATLLIVFVPECRAQVIYTKSNLPVIGQTTVKQWAKSGIIDPQPGGINRTWDFSLLSPLPGRRDTITVIDAKNVIGDVPAEANLAVVNQTTNLREYFNTRKPSLRSLGSEDNDTKSLLGSSPYDIDPIPVKINVTYTHQFDGSVQIVKQPDIAIHRTGSTSFTPDANGTIRLPGTLPATRVIRVRWVDEFIDTVARNNEPMYVAHTLQTRFVWYQEGGSTEYLVIKNGSVKYTRITEDPPKDSIINEAQYLFSDSGASDVETDAEATLQVHPNPATEMIAIEGQCKHDQVVRVRIFNVLGEELCLHEKPSFGGQYALRLPVDMIASQSIILRVEVDGGVVTRVVQLQR